MGADDFCKSIIPTVTGSDVASPPRPNTRITISRTNVHLPVAFVGYTMALNYLIACEDVFWKDAAQGSFITKTVGVQALFDILRLLAQDAYSQRDISAKYFLGKLEAARNINFSDDSFRNASGSGRSTIKKAIQSAIFAT